MVRNKFLSKRITSLVIAFISFVTLFVGFVNIGEARAFDYSRIRVKLTNVNDGSLNVNLKGNYSINGDTQVSGEIIVKNNGGTITVEQKSSGTQLYSGKSAKFIREEDQGSQSGLFRMYNAYNGWCEYLGNIIISADGAKFTVINDIPLDHYLYGVVAHEMNNSWPLEALKAQAVAARGYAAGRFTTKKAYDLGDTPSDQVYKGFNAAHTNVIKAVDATAGVVIKHNGKIVLPYYGASNGGQTELTTNVWTEPRAYCIIKDDPYDLRNPMSPEQTVFFPENVSSETPINSTLAKYLKTLVASDLKSKGYSTFSDQIEILGISNMRGTKRKYDEPSNNFTHAAATIKVKAMKGNDGINVDNSAPMPVKPIFEIVGESATGPVYSDKDGNLMDSGSMQFELDMYEVALEEWEEGKKTLESSGEGFTGSSSTVSVDVEFRIYDLKDKAHGYQLLKNQYLIMYYVKQVAGGAEIVNVRYGHGVGMSQRGAQQMASEGHSYKDILNFYYNDITLEPLGYDANFASLDLSAFAEEGSGSSSSSNSSADEISDLSGTESSAKATKIVGSTKSKTTIFKTASAKGTKLGTINSGVTVNILGQKGEFILINTSTGVNGFVSSKSVFVSNGTGSITKATPLVDSNKKTLKQLKNGENVSIVSRDANNYEVRTSDGTTGFVPYTSLKVTVSDPFVQLSSKKSYGQSGKSIPLYSDKNKSKKTATIPSNGVFEIASKTSNDCYNVIYNGTKGVVEKTNVTLIGKGGTHPNPKILVSTFMGTDSKVVSAYTPIPAVGAPMLNKVGAHAIVGERINAAAQGIVTGMTVNLRSEPNSSSRIIAQLPEDVTVDIVGQNGDFFKVTYDEKTGYVDARFIAVTGGAQVGVVKSDSVNLRSDANSSSTIIRTLPKNTKVAVIGSEGAFFKVELNDGTIGYVADSHLSVQVGIVPDFSASTSSTSGSVNNASSSNSSGSAVATGVITGGNVRLRKSPSANAVILDTIPAGTKVNIVAVNGQYYKIVYNSITGYVHSAYVPKSTIKSIGSSSSSSSQSTTTSSSSEYKSGVVTASVLLVRTQSGTVLLKLQKGDEVTILSTSGSKYKVKTPSGSVGFVESKYIKTASSDSSESNTSTASSSGKKLSANASIIIRSEASTSSARNGMLYKNETATIIGDSGDWYKIDTGSITGYVLKKYMK